MGRGGGGSSGGGGGGSFGGSRGSAGRSASSGRGGRSGGSHSGSSYHSGTSSDRRNSYSSINIHYHPSNSNPYSSGLIDFVITVVFFTLVFFFLFNPIKNWNIQKSTVQRTALDSSYSTEVPYVHDKLGWIKNQIKVEAGMKHFYKKTGVQPVLVITDFVNGTNHPNDEDMETYANELYDYYIPDEAHLLVLFYEYNSDSNYKIWCITGKQAKTVVDNEALNILMDYLDSYYYSDKSEDELFGDAFYDAAKRIMSVTKSPIPVIIVCVTIIALIFLLFVWWDKPKKQKNLEAEQTERILNSDLGQMKDEKLKDLESKYKL